MIIGIGTDIVEIDRIRKAHERHGPKFINRIFTRTEQTYLARKYNPDPHMAVRFAAKEAVAKALGVGIGKVTWRDINVYHDDNYKPHISLSGAARDLMITLSINDIHVSLSHSDNIGVAYVILESVTR